MFTMTGVVSEPSGSDGIAKFTNLTVVGAQSEFAYILISVDGIVATWTEIYNPQNAQFDLPPRGLIPYKI